LWDVLKDEIHKVPITNKIQLKKHLIRIWFHFEKIKALCVLVINGVSKRVAALKQTKGSQTMYLNIILSRFHD